jgi:hypothetical protein
MYELRYVYNLTPVSVAEPLDRGLKYHEVVELILSGKEWSCEDPKIRAMCKAFETYIYPCIKDKVKSTEDWFVYKNGEHEVVGRTDGLTWNGVPIEHKTTGGFVDGTYISHLGLDEQIKTYMLATGSNKILYTICSTPTIRQKKGESEDEFYQRCFDWYAEDTDQKIIMLDVVETNKALNDFKREQKKVITIMQNCKTFYRNPAHCTKWGRMCEYAPICMLSKEELCGDLIGFERKEHHYEKVKKA